MKSNFAKLIPRPKREGERGIPLRGVLGVRGESGGMSSCAAVDKDQRELVAFRSCDPSRAKGSASTL